MAWLPARWGLRRTKAPQPPPYPLPLAGEERAGARGARLTRFQRKSRTASGGVAELLRESRVRSRQSPPATPTVAVTPVTVMPLHLGQIAVIGGDARWKRRDGGGLRKPGNGHQSYRCERNCKNSPYHCSPPWTRTNVRRGHNTPTTWRFHGIQLSEI